MSQAFCAIGGKARIYLRTARRRKQDVGNSAATADAGLRQQFLGYRHSRHDFVMPASERLPRQGLSRSRHPARDVDSLEARSLEPGFRRGDESTFNKL
jgi:hypothetical protein